MKKKFEALKREWEDMTIEEFTEKVHDLTKEILKTDHSLLSVSKHWKGYGTWRSKGFANPYHFGNELAMLLERALSHTTTHDEDKEFIIEDFEEKIYETILENI